MVLAGAPFALALLPIAATIAAFVLPGMIGRLRAPEAHFQQIFGESPPKSFSDLRASTSGGPDFAVEYVGFRARTDDLVPWLAKRGFRPNRSTDDPLVSGDEAQPDWWPKHPCRALRFYSRAGFADWDEVIVLLCPQTGTVFAMASQID